MAVIFCKRHFKCILDDTFHVFIYSVFIEFCPWGSSWQTHYNDVIMGAIASQITSLTIVFSTVYLDTDQRKYQSSASLAFVRGIHRRPVNSPHKWPVTRKMFPFDGVIMSNVAHPRAKPSPKTMFTWVFDAIWLQWYIWWRRQMEIFSALLALCGGIHRSPVNFPHKGQWRAALVFSLICAWMNGWVNNHETGDLRRHRTHYDATIMYLLLIFTGLH